MSQRPINIKGHRRIRLRNGDLAPQRKPAKGLHKHGAELQRVSKIMAHRGLCSRREAERLIDMGQVEVDGEIIRQQGVKAKLDADIRLLEDGQQFMAQKATILFNKPRGVLSMQIDDEVGTAAWECLNPELGEGPMEMRTLIGDYPRSFNVAGRLDRESHGLLVMTQNGRLVRHITQSSLVEKEYHVAVHRPITTDDLQRLKQPIQFDGETVLPVRTEQIAGKRLKFILREGRKHQIRLICRALGLRVIDLKRVRIGPWKIDDIKEGHWCSVSPKDVKRLLTKRAKGKE